jgi:lipoprotein-anchoring transpeptidase ErfK/SrfK
MRIGKGQPPAKIVRLNIERTIFSLLAAFSLFLLTGCANQPLNPNPPAQTPAANTANTAPPKPSPAATATYNLPITLPLLDAMFSDDQFAADLKEKAGLTDDEIEKLRTISQEAVQNLSEDDESAGFGSTRQSVERAANDIRNALGDEKANRVLELVRQRYEGEGDMLPMKPNDIPTDTRIVVNAPAYRMDLFQDGKLIKTYKVAIGYPEFPLPTGLRKAQSIIFNPKWTPPDEPWVKGKFAPGKTVAAGSKLNPLGLLKVPIGLPSLIHGGKNPARLGTFGSHGCVGLTDGQVNDFAMLLSQMAGQPLTLDEIKSYEAKNTETKDVKLSNAVPVELRYETIVVEDGKLHIYRDVYEHGTNTTENLEQVLAVYGLSMNDLDPNVRSQIEDGLNKMAYDAKGNPVDESANTDQGNKKKSTSAKVTRTIKGEKEVVIDVPKLAGKGYPAPVNLSER